MTSTALLDNPALQRASEKVGYEPNGRGLTSRGTGRVEMRRFRLTREAWLRTERPDVRLVGLDGVLRQLGLERPE